MSDPMTNTEVEDVLASIRRLVSDDKRPEVGVPPKTPADRLVLTPSLRVMEENDTQVETVDEEAAQDTPEDAQPAIEERAFDDSQDNVAVYEDEHEPPVAEPDDAQDSKQEDAHAEAVAGELEAMDMAHSDTANETTAEPEAEETSAELMPEQSEDAPSADGQGDSALDADVEADLDADALVSNDIAQDVTAPEDWAHDVDTLAEPTFENEGEASLDMDGPTEILSTDADVDNIEPDTAHDTNASAQSLGEKIAALETLVGKRRETFEPDDPGADAYAGTEAPAMEWEDADEAPAADVFAGAASEHAEEPQAQLFSNDEDVLDEEALRELVSDIVREELQGVLGERITRNVRKLVRREIHRALAAQDLE